jgi:maleylpyruvate isomerase
LLWVSYDNQMDSEQRDLQEQIDHATRRLLQTVSRLSDDDLNRPSLLPGWTRRYVLTHLARGAEAMRNLLTGEPAYSSPQARDADIHAGAGRDQAEQLADLTDSAAAFRSCALALPDHAWELPVRVLDYPEFPAAQMLARRLVEVELHHTDLGIGYGPAEWPARFADMELPEPMRSQRNDRKLGELWGAS